MMTARRILHSVLAAGPLARRAARPGEGRRLDRTHGVGPGPLGGFLHQRSDIRESLRVRVDGESTSTWKASSACACEWRACGWATSSRVDGVSGAAGPAGAGGFAQQRPLVPARGDHRQRYGSRLPVAAGAQGAARVAGSATAARIGTRTRAASRRSISAIRMGIRWRCWRSPPDKGNPKWHRGRDRLFLGIDHTAIVISDTEASLRFYRDRWDWK